MSTDEWEQTTPRVLFARLQRRGEIEAARTQRSVRLTAIIAAEIRNTMRTKESDTFWTAEMIMGTGDDGGAIPSRAVMKAKHAALRASLIAMQQRN